MNEKVIEGIHSIVGNTLENGHSYSDNVMFGLHKYSNNVTIGLHMTMWFGDRFIAGIQDERGYFIVDKASRIIFEE